MDENIIESVYRNMINEFINFEMKEQRNNKQ